MKATKALVVVNDSNCSHLKFWKSQLPDNEQTAVYEDLRRSGRRCASMYLGVHAPGEVEDIVHTAIVNYFAYLEDHSKPGSPCTNCQPAFWKITRNICFDRLRRDFLKSKNKDSTGKQQYDGPKTVEIPAEESNSTLSSPYSLEGQIIARNALSMLEQNWDEVAVPPWKETLKLWIFEWIPKHATETSTIHDFIKFCAQHGLDISPARFYANLADGQKKIRKWLENKNP